jgi:RND family efflux transporter MFP subunit
MIFVALVSVSIAFIVGCTRKRSATSVDPECVSVAVPIVDSITIYRTYPAYASANATVDVVGRVDGLLLSKEYNAGDIVKKGQVLFTLEPTTYVDAVTQAQSQLATAESQLDYASRQYRAMAVAMESDAVSQMDLIQAENNMLQAEASVKKAKAALNTALVNLNYCTVTAPITGMITSSTSDVGNYIGGEASPVTLATLYDVSSIVFEFAVEDTQYEQMIAAMDDPLYAASYRHIPLTFSPALPHDYEADLFYTSPAVDRSTGTVVLKVRVDNPYGELSPGMYATVNMPFATMPRAVLVMDRSISTDQLGRYLYVVNDSNRVVYTPIEAGELYHDSLRVVTKGVDPTSRYVTSALLKVRDGMKVNAVMSNR